MSIIDGKQLFDEEFATYYKTSSSDYLNALLEYANDKLDLKETISARIEELQSVIVDYAVSKYDDDEDDYVIDEVKRYANISLMRINDYLQSLKPHESFNLFINGNLRDLLIVSERYSAELKDNLRKNLTVIRKNTSLEIEFYKIYGETIETLDGVVYGEDGDFPMYNTMNHGIIDMNDLTQISKYVDDLLIESSIISKFDNKVRTYIAKKIDKDHGEKEYALNDNVCSALLTNYALLSLYSTTPEKVKISDKMLETILFEIENGTISKSDIEETILDGPIKFSTNELNYINNNFVGRLLYDDDDSLKYDVVSKIVK